MEKCMDESARLTQLERAKEAHDRRLEEHNRRIAELFKGHEDHLALLADHEWLSVENQRRIKQREDEDERHAQWRKESDLRHKRIELNLQEAAEKLNALIHWDMQRHGYPEGGTPPAE